MCINHPALCRATATIRTNVHRCFLEPSHEGPHLCACYYRFPAGDPASSATAAPVTQTESRGGSYVGGTLPSREKALSGGEA